MAASRFDIKKATKREKKPKHNKIKIILDEVSNQRGIFFELPVFDLNDIKELKSLTIFDSERDIILSNYEYDFQLNLNLSQSNINKWIIFFFNHDKSTICG